jgi:hypothetical protein
MLFAPLPCDLLQRLLAECKPSRFDSVSPNGPLEIPERPGAMDGIQKIFANPAGLHRLREILHDGPLVNIKLCGKCLETVRGTNSPRDLPFALLPCGKIRLLAVFGIFCLTQKIAGDIFHLSCIEIQVGGEFVELDIQSVDNVVQANSRGHVLETIILLSDGPVQ